MSKPDTSAEIRNRLTNLVEDAMGDFPTEHMLAFHVDAIASLYDEYAKQRELALLERLERVADYQWEDPLGEGSKFVPLSAIRGEKEKL